MRLLKQIFLLITACFSLTVSAELPTPRVSLITCHAGSDIYELCGHSALRLQVNGDDIAVNYGVFDFNAPNFVYRFVKGETDYMVGTYPFNHFLYSYVRDGRRVVEHELNLTPQQAWRVVELIQENLRPENRVYRYNYVKDNCATRPIAIIEKAIGDTIRFSQSHTPGSEHWSFRDEMRHFHKNYPWYQFGIDLCLGSGVDYPISTREKGFAPEMLEQILELSSIPDTTGTEIPLISATRILNEGKAGGAIEPPTPWYLTPVALFSLLFIAVAFATWRDIRRKSVTRWVDTVLFGIFGIEGCLLTFLIFISVHEATSPNWLYLWLNPLCFIAATAVWIKRGKRLLMSYHFANFVALFLLSVLLVCGIQTGNTAFAPLIAAAMIRSLSYIYINRCAIKKKA